MKKLTSFIVSLILLLSLSTGVKAEFFSDIIVTSPNAIWTDSRAYTNLPAAINAVGSLQRTIVISSQQSIGNMTVPSNVTLKFERDGAIINSGQLTINTKNIIAENRQIFAGAGDIDFASGTVLKSGWFSTFERALSVTSDDTVTLLITKAQTLTTTTASGNNVTLKWDSPGNILTANAGVTISNIGQVESENYQLFAGAGNFRFRDGTKLNLSWFANLRAFLTYASTNKLTLTVPGANAVDYSDTIPSTILLDMDSQHGQFTVAPGITLSFSGYTKDIYAHWFGDLTKATLDTVKASVGTTNKVTVVLIPGTWTIDDDLTITSNISLKVQPGALLAISTTKTLTINGPFDAGLYQVFSCKGTGKVTFGNGSIESVNPQWFGLSESGAAAANTTALQNAINSYSIVSIPHGIYKYDQVTITNANQVIKGVGSSSQLYKTTSVTGTNGIYLNLTGQPYNGSISGLTLSGAAYNDGATALYIKGSPSETIAHGKISDIYFLDIETGIYLYDTMGLNFGNLYFRNYTNGIKSGSSSNDHSFTGLFFYDGNTAKSSVPVDTTNMNMCVFTNLVVQGTGIQKALNEVGGWNTYIGMRVESINGDNDSDWVTVSGNYNKFIRPMLTSLATTLPGSGYWFMNVSGNHNEVDCLPIEWATRFVKVSGNNNKIGVAITGSTLNASTSYGEFVRDEGYKNTLIFNGSDTTFDRVYTKSTGQMTNYFTQSTDFSGITADGVVSALYNVGSEYGPLNMGEIYNINTPTGNRKWSQAFSVTNKYYYVFSLMLKAVSATEDVDIICGANTTTFTTVSVPADRYIRVYVLTKATSTTNYYAGFRIGAASGGIIATMPQVSESIALGGHVIGPGGYVPTGSTARTMYNPNYGLVTSSKAVPAWGSHRVGRIVYNLSPAEAGSGGSKYVIQGWICTVAGAPGTWLQMRTLTGN